MAKFSLIDSPIECCADDSLEITRYVDAMHKFIKGCDTPLTIGIQGDWGIGKTSFLNMLIDKFSSTKGREARCHTIYFNTWQYAQFKQEEMLSLSILRGIVTDLELLASGDDKEDREKILTGAKKFGKFVTSLGNQVVKAQTGIDLNEASQSLAKDQDAPDLVSLITDTKRHFAALVRSITNSELTDKLVIIIDDLDRLKPIRALEFLEAVKNFLDVPGCVFLIAVDYSVIQRGMEEKLGRTAQEMQGKSYFDKIIQVPFNMPTGAFKTDSYIMAMLGWQKSGDMYKRKVDGDPYLGKGKAPSQEDVDFFANVTRLTVGTNPRSIKRSISYASLLKIILQQSQQGTRFPMRDAKLLYALASLQLAWPEVFAHLVENPVHETVSRLQDFDFLESGAMLSTLFRRVHNPDEVKSNITAYFDELLAVIDENDDGVISRAEFRVIPDILKKANMMATELGDLDQMWQVFRGMVKEATKGKFNSAEVTSALNLFRDEESAWNSRLQLRLIPAGKRFVNVLWSKHQIGSLVTTQKEPLQFYVKCNPEELINQLSEGNEFVTDVRTVGHYGIGNSKIDLFGLGGTDGGIQVFNRIHALTLQLNKI